MSVPSLKRRVCRNRFVKLISTGFTLGIISLLHEDLPRLEDVGPNLKLPIRSPCKSGSQVTGPVFFIDVSGDSCMTPRRACSIESAALANPEATVTVFSNSETIADSEWDSRLLYRVNTKHCNVGHLLSTTYTNIKLEKLSMTAKLAGSRLAKLYTSGAFNRSYWRQVHMQHALSWIISEEQGGVYLDSNIISFAPVGCLRDTLVLDSDEASPDVIAFSQGHSFSRFFLRYVLKTYQPEYADTMGSPLITSALKLYCSANQLQPGTLSCHNNIAIEVLGSETFFPISQARRFVLYQEKPKEWGDIDLENSFGMKIFSSEWNQELHNTTLYGRLMKTYCPLTFANTAFNDYEHCVSWFFCN